MSYPFTSVTRTPAGWRLALALIVALALFAGGCGRSQEEPPAIPAEAPAPTLPATATSQPVQSPTPAAAAATPLPSPSPTIAAEPTKPPSRIVRALIPAPSLSENLVGEKPERTVMIYLPPSYHSSEARYPVIYYLPGYGDSDFLGFTPGIDTDELMESGAIPEFIFVSASGVSELGGSFYVNSPVTGNWEDFVAKDLVAYVDANFRTLAQPESRGMAGHSMGGFGALNMGMHRPDVFGSVYSMSPGAFDPSGLAESQMFASARAIDAYLEMEADLSALAPEDAAKQMTRQFGDLGFAVAYGMAFVPNPEKQPPLSDYPYRREGEELVRDEAEWQRWEAGYGNLAGKVEEYADNLKSLRGLVVDVGTFDNYAWIPKGVAYLGEQLEAAGIPHEVLTYEGSHQDKLKQRWLESALPFFARTLAVE